MHEHTRTLAHIKTPQTCTLLQTLQRPADALQSFTQFFLQVGFSYNGAQLLAEPLGLGQLGPPSLQL